MITVTRLNGGAFALNPDLVERVESTPDTVITLVDGTKYVVRESVEEIVYRVREAKASVIALSHSLDVASADTTARMLRVVPDADASWPEPDATGPNAVRPDADRPDTDREV